MTTYYPPPPKPKAPPKPILAPTLLAFLCAAPLSAQNLVTNGEFTGTDAPWVLGGAYSFNPGWKASIDVTGRGVSDSFGVNAGGQVTPSPYPPNTIEQSVCLVPGSTYEFRMDAIGYRNSATGNADIGTIWVELEGIEIARFGFGRYTSPEVKRAEICGRHVAIAGGPAQLVIYFQRLYLGGSSNPRMNIDNVSLQEIVGPTFCVRGNRLLGSPIDFVVEGAPTAPYVVYVATGLLPAGIPFLPLSGQLWLDPSTHFTLFLGGNLDASGVGTTTLSIPVIPDLTVTPISCQAIAALRPTLGFSLPTTLVMSQ